MGLMATYIYANNKQMKITLFMVFGMMLCKAAVSQADVSSRLDSFLKEVYKYGQINGNVLAAEKGKIIYKKSFGYADILTGKLNNDSSGFTMGSIAKIFTSTAILQLRDKGRLKLDDPLVKYFRDFRTQ